VVIVDHAVRHLREESGLDDDQIAKVLLTASFVLTDMITSGLTWNAVATANWLGLCGEKLWREAGAQQATPDETEPEPPADSASKWWAVWETDGRLREVVEFDEPRREPDVRYRLIADFDSAFLPPAWELMALTEAWAKRLRRLIEIGGAQ
jgi:ADP-ribose pyrophosphatase YjhB (NUDIX family)